MGRINKVKTFPVLNHHNACVIFTFFVCVVLNVKTYSPKFVIGIDKRALSCLKLIYILNKDKGHTNGPVSEISNNVAVVVSKTCVGYEV